ncbi:MAG TPA: hypothetical protein VI387_03520 [Candidatus Brocadiales bacterium]|nr:hypothetical protein [Candidatus Brocadiales bacterium]
MQTISLKTSSPKKALPLIIDAIEREKRILMDSIAITQKNINSLARKLHVNISHLEKGKVIHTEENEEELIELEGELSILKSLNEEMKSLEDVKLCP